MKTPSLPTLFLILALGSALIIGSALFSQYVLAMDPCGLVCVSVWGIMWRSDGVNCSAVFCTTIGGSRPVSMILSVVVLLALGFSLYWASFHIGVEQKWWPGLESCGGGGDTSDISLEQWLNPEGGTAYVPCDQPPSFSAGFSAVQAWQRSTRCSTTANIAVGICCGSRLSQVSQLKPFRHIPTCVTVPVNNEG